MEINIFELGTTVLITTHYTQEARSAFRVRLIIILVTCQIKNIIHVYD